MGEVLRAVSVVCVVLLAGCGGFGANSESSLTTTGESPTTTAQPTTETTSRPTTETTTTQPTTETATQSTTEVWSSPQPPNKPFENKLEEGVTNHIESVEVRDSGESVELRIAANTSLRNIDPPEHGTVRGEPFFLVYANGSLTNESRYDPRFYIATGSPVQRSSELRFEQNGTFTLTIPQAAFEAADTETGEVELLVVLFDKDSQWDDVYGTATVNATYTPDE